MWYTKINSNIIVYQKYIRTSIKVGCATRSCTRAHVHRLKESWLTNRGDGDQDPEIIAKYHERWERKVRKTNFSQRKGSSKATEVEVNLCCVKKTIIYEFASQYLERQENEILAKGNNSCKSRLNATICIMSRFVHILNSKSISQKTGDNSKEKQIVAKCNNSLKADMKKYKSLKTAAIFYSSEPFLKQGIS